MQNCRWPGLKALEPVGLVDFFGYQPTAKSLKNPRLWGSFGSLQGEKCSKTIVFSHFYYSKGLSPTDS